MHAKNAKKKNCCGKKICVYYQRNVGINGRNKKKPAIKKMHKQPRKYSIQEILKNKKDEVLKNENNNLDFDCIILKLCK